MRKAKNTSKQVLVTGETISFPRPQATDNDKIFAKLREIAKQKKAKFGLNSVIKAASKDELKLVIVPNCVEYIEKYQPLFQILISKKIPILSLDAKESELAKNFGNMKSLLAVGIICDIPEEFIQLTTTLKHVEGLPNIQVEIDSCASGKTKSKNKNIE